MNQNNDLRRTHDAMARFLLLQMLVHSDKVWKGKRMPVVEKHYREALCLVREAGLKYEPPVDKPFVDRWRTW